jgi:hypothetical protein
MADIPLHPAPPPGAGTPCPPVRTGRPLPRRRRLAASLVLVPALALLPAPTGAGEAAGPARGQADERAAAVADRVMEALGGEEAWAATRYLRFGFAGRRLHTWDRFTGRHRLEGTGQDGEPYVVLEDLGHRTGEVFVGGERVTGDDAAERLEAAYAAWINDTYWLLAPYKLRDPGVVLAWEGTESLDGVEHDKLALSFEQVGLTPGDRYWLWVSRDTGLVDRWAYVLEHQPPDAEPTAWDWRGWQRYGGIELAPLRQQADGDRRLELAPIEVPNSLPDSVFESPEAVP